MTRRSFVHSAFVLKFFQRFADLRWTPGAFQNCLTTSNETHSDIDFAKSWLHHQERKARWHLSLDSILNNGTSQTDHFQPPHCTETSFVGWILNYALALLNFQLTLIHNPMWCIPKMATSLNEEGFPVVATCLDLPSPIANCPDCRISRRRVT